MLPCYFENQSVAVVKKASLKRYGLFYALLIAALFLLLVGGQTGLDLIVKLPGVFAEFWQIFGEILLA